MRRVMTAALIVIAALLVVPSAIAGRGGDGAKDNDTRVQILALQRLPRQPRAEHAGDEPGRSRSASRPAAIARRRRSRPAASEYLATHVQGAPGDEPEHAHRRLGRPDRRVAADLGPLPRRADDRGAQPRRPRRQRRGQPRVRRGRSPRSAHENGGCHPVDGCHDGTPFLGLDLRVPGRERHLQGTRTTRSSRRTRSTSSGNAKIAVVGMTLEGTPLDRDAAAVAEIDFHDEADTVNTLVPKLKQARYRDDRRPAARGRLTRTRRRRQRRRIRHGWAGRQQLRQLQRARSSTSSIA